MTLTYPALANLAFFSKRKKDGGPGGEYLNLYANQFKANQQSSLHKGEGKPELLATYSLPRGSTLNVGGWA